MNECMLNKPLACTMNMNVSRYVYNGYDYISLHDSMSIMNITTNQLNDKRTNGGMYEHMFERTNQLMNEQMIQWDAD